MEDTNEVGSSEISRLENLERVVHKFKIASAGDGAVLGGFGTLPKNQSELSFKERLANVQQARAKFELVGHNVAVDGNFIDGLIAS